MLSGPAGLESSTTVTIRQNTFVGSSGASINLQGSASGATIIVSDNIIEGGQYGVKVSTDAVISRNHFEANAVSDILYSGNATVKADANNFQHSANTPIADMTGGGIMYWGTNSHFLVAGQTLAYVPTGARWHNVGANLLS